MPAMTTPAFRELLSEEIVLHRDPAGRRTLLIDGQPIPYAISDTITVNTNDKALSGVGVTILARRVRVVDDYLADFPRNAPTFTPRNSGACGGPCAADRADCCGG